MVEKTNPRVPVASTKLDVIQPSLPSIDTASEKNTSRRQSATQTREDPDESQNAIKARELLQESLVRKS